MKTVNRKFNVGDWVVTKNWLQETASGARSLKTACRKIVRISEFVEDETAVYLYRVDSGAEYREEHFYPAKDAKKMVMKILAERMQDVAGMEVPE